MDNQDQQIEKSSQKQVQILPVSVDYCLSNCKTCPGWYFIDTIEATCRLLCKCPCGHPGA